MEFFSERDNENKKLMFDNCKKEKEEYSEDIEYSDELIEV